MLAREEVVNLIPEAIEFIKYIPHYAAMNVIPDDETDKLMLTITYRHMQTIIIDPEHLKHFDAKEYANTIIKDLLEGMIRHGENKIKKIGSTM